MTMSMSFGTLPMSDGHRRRVHEGLAHPELRRGLAALLRRRVPQAEVAARIGLYDQSQLHRHFKRIAGVTPGEYVRAMR